MNSLLVFFSVCVAAASAAQSLSPLTLGGYGAGVQHVQYVQQQPMVHYVQQPQVQYVQQPQVQYVQQPQVQLQHAPLVHHATYSSPIQTQQVVQVAAPARQVVQAHQPASYSYSYSSGIRRGVSSANNVKYVAASTVPVQTTQVLQPTIGLGGYGGLGGSQILLGSGGYSGGYPTIISSHK